MGEYTLLTLALMAAAYLVGRYHGYSANYVFCQTCHQCVATGQPHTCGDGPWTVLK